VRNICVNYTFDVVGDQNENKFAGGGSDAGLHALALLGSRLGQLGIDLAGVLPVTGTAEPREVGVVEIGNKAITRSTEEAHQSLDMEAPT
jgi:hypothetical protein